MSSVEWFAVPIEDVTCEICVIWEEEPTPEERQRFMDGLFDKIKVVEAELIVEHAAGA